MAESWRLLDSGLAAPARNIALSRALLEARDADECASTLRFARYTRSALIPHDAAAAEVLDLAYCRSHGIAVHRRVTGGPIACLDERQLVFELYLHRRDLGDLDLRALAKRICHAAATGISALGVDARFRSRSDIEIGGRRLAAGGYAVDRDGVLFQAALMVDADPVEAVCALRSPKRRLGDEVRTAAARRLVTLKSALGRRPDMRTVKQNLMEAFESEFDVEFREADLNLSEQARFDAALGQIDTAGWIDHVPPGASALTWVEATHDTPAGALHAAAAVDARLRVVRQLWFLGDAPAVTARASADLEAALRDIPLERCVHRIEWFYANRPAEPDGYAAADVIAVVRRVVEQPLHVGKT